MHIRVDWDTGRIAVELSRRNLLTLLAKLDGHPPNSACTIEKDFIDVYLSVKAVPDEDAYRDHPPGEMHPATEARVVEVLGPNHSTSCAYRVGGECTCGVAEGGNHA